MKRLLSIFAFSVIASSMTVADAGTIRKMGNAYFCDIPGGDLVPYEPGGRVPTVQEQVKCQQAGGKIKFGPRKAKSLNNKSKGFGSGKPVNRKRIQKRRICGYYTHNAIEAHQKNLRFRCGYRGPAWTNNRRAHFNWCLKVPVMLSIHESNKRKNAINTCIKKLSYCRRYAARAIAQQRMNLQWRCGFRGALWSNSTINHQNWCIRVNVRRSSNDTRRRDHLLRRCRAKKRASRR